ncbi:MAG: F0F1 ATP synthase subunit epsilon [Gemmatimonadota bacterium]
MNVQVVVPTRVVDEWADVDFVRAYGLEGSMGVLPRRRDFVSSLVPGIVTIRRGSDSTFVAVDGGLLVKQGSQVTVATPQAVTGRALEDLSRMVSDEFEMLDEKEKRARSALADLELRFARRFLEQEWRWKA